MDRKAIIDIGSNSIKFFVGEPASDGTVATVTDANDIARLGEGLDKTGALSTEAMERNARAVERFAAQAKELGANEVVAVGTMALRRASNSGEFLALVRDACGLEVRILPGEEEARLAYLAVLSALPLTDGEIVIFDTGGGSTEFIFGHGAHMDKRFSVDLGAVRITENYFSGQPPFYVEEAERQIDRELAAAGVEGRPAQLIGMGGTVTSMGAVKHQMTTYDPAVIQGSVLTAEDIAGQIERYRTSTLAERRSIPGLQPKRAEVILAGACILRVIARRLGAEQLTISDRGLRHGLAYDMFHK